MEGLELCLLICFCCLVIEIQRFCNQFQAVRRFLTCQYCTYIAHGIIAEGIAANHTRSCCCSGHCRKIHIVVVILIAGKAVCAYIRTRLHQEIMPQDHAGF